MRRSLTIAALTVALLLVAAPGGFALLGALPEGHGLSGRGFGTAVSDQARNDPRGLTDHVGVAGNAAPGGANGMPAGHGTSGRDFGQAVAELARSAPGALSSHVREQVGPDRARSGPRSSRAEGSTPPFGRTPLAGIQRNG